MVITGLRLQSIQQAKLKVNTHSHRVDVKVKMCHA